MLNPEKFVKAIRDVPDFPQKGVIFKDITPLLKDGALFREYIDDVAERHADDAPDHIVVIESRGFIFGSALAYKFGCGVVPVRKSGKLPHDTYQAKYKLEYGEATVEIHRDALNPGDKVLLVDDLLATGGTALAAIGLVENLEARIIGVEFLIELAFLDGRAKLGSRPVNALIVVD